MRGVSSIKRIKFVIFVFFFLLPALLYMLIGVTDLYSVCENYRFLYDGARINDDDTPQSLEMEDNGNVVSFSRFSARRSDWPNIKNPLIDTIDVMVERTSCSDLLLSLCFPFRLLSHTF